MPNAWDALGRGISGGEQAYLTGKQRQEEEKRYAAAESMEKERLGLARFQASQGMEQYEGQQALGEQLRAEERHGAEDPRSDPSRGIYIPMFAGEKGSYIPLSQAERDRMYGEQLTAWENKEASLADIEHQRRLEELKYSAEMQHQYSYPPAYAAEAEKPEPSFFLPNGEVNNSVAWAFLQEWKARNMGDPGSNPQFLERFLRDVELMTGVPGAREKAQLWLMQQIPQTGQVSEPVAPPGNILEQIRQAVPPAAAAATKVPWPIGFGIPPAIPTGQELRSTGQNILEKIQGLLNPSPPANPTSDPPSINTPPVRDPWESRRGRR